MSFQHCPVYPCKCERCQTGIDMGLVRLVRERHMRVSNPKVREAALCIVDDCTTVLEHDTRYPKVGALALQRLQTATGHTFR